MVTIEYECETDFDLGLDCPVLAKMVADKVLDMEKCPWDAQVNLVLTDNEEIKRVNTEFRGIERATDVLSFPMLPFETPADYSVAEDDESCFDLDSGELLLGDIMISAERAAAQAEEYGHSVKREFCFLVAHSMLHLLFSLKFPDFHNTQHLCCRFKIKIHHLFFMIIYNISSVISRKTYKRSNKPSSTPPLFPVQ